MQIWNVIRAATGGVILALAGAMGGCQQPPAGAEGSLEELGAAICGDRVSIVAGQDLDAGSVVVSDDGANLYVTATANTADAWALRVIHLFAGTGSIPVNFSGAPIPGHFPYSASFDPAVTAYTFTISLADLEVGCGDTLTLAVHTESVRLDDDGAVVEEETGWGRGAAFEDTNRWGWFFTYEICCEASEALEG